MPHPALSLNPIASMTQNAAGPTFPKPSVYWGGNQRSTWTTPCPPLPRGEWGRDLFWRGSRGRSAGGGWGVSPNLLSPLSPARAPERYLWEAGSRGAAPGGGLGVSPNLLSSSACKESWKHEE